MGNKVIICSDSTSDLGGELITRYGVRILPLKVNLGGKSFADGVNITPDVIYAHYEQHGELPKTAAPNMADFYDFFEKNTADGSEVVFFTISKSMSSTYNNARLAAMNYQGVYVVDTCNLSTGGGLLVVAACEMAKAGKNGAEIARAVGEMTARVDASFVIDNLEFLHKGGRCSALAAFGANLLQLKPCITVADGRMGVAKKYRGKFARVLEMYVADRIGDGKGIDSSHVFVTHAGLDAALVDACVNQVKALLPEATVHITRAGCTVSAHCGRDTLGVLFLRK